MSEPLEGVCIQCPWRLANQGARHPSGFYTKKNLIRLWNQIRGGGWPQSCHLTDPNHPDHVKAGCKPDATPRECPGSVVIVVRELLKLRGPDPEHAIEPEDCDRYLKDRRRHGLKRSGLLYWLLERVKFGGIPFFGGSKVPNVNLDDPAIGLPTYLREG